MNLRDKVIEGFVATYIENEQVILRNLLQTGRIDREEWKQLSQELQEIKERYNQDVIAPEEFIQKRKKLRKEFNKSQEQKQAGLTRDEAEKLYLKIKEEQERALKKAYNQSGHSTIRIATKILSNRIKFIVARLKTI